MFATRPAAAALAPFVTGYWFVEDLAGAHPCDVPIHTAPRPGAVLTVHLGRPNESELPVGAPAVSLLGVQSRARAWWSRGDCYFVMVMLSVPGVLRLFPGLGFALGDGMLELGSVLGDRATRRLRADVVGAFTPERIAARLDAWLLARLRSRPPVEELVRFTHAFDSLARTGRVDAAATAAGVSRRQLERWSARHVGHAPKALAGLFRLHESLHAAQTGLADPRDGFCDQAHQIRAWRGRLGTTPGRYARSELAGRFLQGGVAHFL
jgi:AraC-like DNA-binding protein